MLCRYARFAGFRHPSTSPRRSKPSQITWAPVSSISTKLSFSAVGFIVMSVMSTAVARSIWRSSAVPNVWPVLSIPCAPLTATSVVALPLSVRLPVSPVTAPAIDVTIADGPSGGRKPFTKDSQDSIVRSFSLSRGSALFSSESISLMATSSRRSISCRRVKSFEKRSTASCLNSRIDLRSAEVGRVALIAPLTEVGSISARSRFHAVYGASLPRRFSLTNEMNWSTEVEFPSCCTNRIMSSCEGCTASRYISRCIRSLMLSG